VPHSHPIGVNEEDKHKAVNESNVNGAGAKAASPAASVSPQRSGLVLAALILVAAVANLNLAVSAGIVSILLGAVIVFFLFPRKEQEETLLAQCHAQDTA
jgi:DHA2 family multidrug resistance protein-like MFS transporter